MSARQDIRSSLLAYRADNGLRALLYNNVMTKEEDYWEETMTL